MELSFYFRRVCGKGAAAKTARAVALEAGGSGGGGGADRKASRVAARAAPAATRATVVNERGEQRARSLLYLSWPID